MSGDLGVTVVEEERDWDGNIAHIGALAGGRLKEGEASSRLFEVYLEGVFSFSALLARLSSFRISLFNSVMHDQNLQVWPHTNTINLPSERHVNLWRRTTSLSDSDELSSVM